jgi:hypothetical protein
MYDILSCYLFGVNLKMIPELKTITDAIGIPAIMEVKHPVNKPARVNMHKVTDYSRMYFPTTPTKPVTEKKDNAPILPGQMDFRDTSELVTQCKACDKGGSLRCRYYMQATNASRCMFLKHETFCDYCAEYTNVK